MRKKISLLLLFILNSICLLLWLDILYPPNLNKIQHLSRQVLDHSGELVYLTLSSDDTWRISATTLPETYKKLLIHIEDKNFFQHRGIDFGAIIRAGYQNLKARRVISGASTLTMQTARLLEPRPRTFKNKIIEAFRAWQLERRLSKNEILQIYSTLAPMGGNIEGINAAALYYFNKPVTKLSLSEIAWLITVPQAPNRLKYPQQSLKARNQLLNKAYQNGVISQTDYENASKEMLTLHQYSFPRYAPHYSQKQLSQHPQENIILTALDLSLQKKLEKRLTKALAQLDNKSNLAAAIIDNHTAQILAYLGSADYYSVRRKGQNDLLTAIRSPGSALKPFITLYAFEYLRYQANSKIDDTPITTLSYRPTNYDGYYRGTITLTEALVASRNIPAVRLLAEIGAETFTQYLKKNQLPLYFSKNDTPNLSLALGGVGIKGIDLLRLYGKLAQCTYNLPTTPPLLASHQNCQQLTYILRQIGDKNGYIIFGKEPVALKTGTAYGWRDKWVIAYTKQYTLMLWSGRADGGYTENTASAEVLIPIMRDIIHLLPNPPHADPLPLSTPLTTHQLPTRLQRTTRIDEITPGKQFILTSPANHSQLTLVSYPHTIIAQLKNGKPPYEWYLNQKKIGKTYLPQQNITLSHTGRYQLNAIDANGEQTISHFQAVTPSKTPKKTPIIIEYNNVLQDNQ